MRRPEGSRNSAGRCLARSDSPLSISETVSWSPSNRQVRTSRNAPSRSSAVRNSVAVLLHSAMEALVSTIRVKSSQRSIRGRKRGDQKPLSAMPTAVSSSSSSDLAVDGKRRLKGRNARKIACVPESAGTVGTEISAPSSSRRPGPAVRKNSWDSGVDRADEPLPIPRTDGGMAPSGGTADLALPAGPRPTDTARLAVVVTGMDSASHNASANSSQVGGWSSSRSDSISSRITLIRASRSLITVA